LATDGCDIAVTLELTHIFLYFFLSVVAALHKQKTSLIKALAQHTGRSIVNVPLSKISTNAEFMSQLFDKTYRVKGEISVRLDFKDVSAFLPMGSKVQHTSRDFPLKRTLTL